MAGRNFPQPFPGEAVERFGIDANRVGVFTVPLDNARTLEKFPFVGNFLWCVSASSRTVSATIVFSDSQSDGVPFKEGSLVAGIKFDEVYITNTAQAGGTLTFIYLVEDLSSVRIVNPADQFDNISVITPTTVTTTADDSVAAISTELVLAANATRKEALITNLKANLSVIRVGDSSTGASRGVEVSPGQTVTLATTAAIYVYNADAAAQSVGLLEIKE